VHTLLNKKILIADDDINIIASLKFVLADEGFDIVGGNHPAKRRWKI